MPGVVIAGGMPTEQTGTKAEMTNSRMLQEQIIWDVRLEKQTGVRSKSLGFILWILK